MSMSLSVGRVQRSVIRWEEPAHVEVDWYAIAAELRARPGEWALIRKLPPNYEAPQGTARLIRDGRLPAFAPGGSFDADAEITAEAVLIYARYAAVGAKPSTQSTVVFTGRGPGR